MKERVLKKLNVLADAAKYDVSCSSSGSNRPAKDGGLGNAALANSLAAGSRFGKKSPNLCGHCPAL